MSSLLIEKSLSVVCQLATADIGFLSIEKVLLYFFDPEVFDSNRDNTVE